MPDEPEHSDFEREAGAVDLAGAVRGATVGGLPPGYIYGVTRYADVILHQAFPDRLDDFVDSLGQFHPTLDELRAGGGGRAVFTARFDKSLEDQRTASGERVWGKRNITIGKTLGFDGVLDEVSKVRGHEIDMFGIGSPDEPLPGVAVEMEWNNKDPFFDRDLNNFAALHREGAIAVGIIVTRGPRLQSIIGSVVQSKDGGLKFGPSTTHWSKLIPKVNLGGGGECPLFLVGIEPSRVEGIELAVEAKRLIEAANAATDKTTWRERFPTYADAKSEAKSLKAQARELLPPVRGGD